MDSPLCYVGGKSKLSNIIADLLPKHSSYCEVFFGAGWVFFRKRASRFEYINDLDGDLVCFFRVVQHHLEEFLKQFKWLLSSRQWWDDWNKQLACGGLTDIQRAARYYYVQRQAFGGKVRNRVFGTGIDSYPRVNILRIEEELSDVHMRLAGVMIENLDWQQFVDKYDSPGTLFYLDPPYFSQPVYRFNFSSISDYRQMSEVLRKIKGRFLLSINDLPEIRDVFSGYHIRPVELTYSLNRDTTTVGKELLIANYDLATV
jgi:DNA adenine methylase